MTSDHLLSQRIRFGVFAVWVSVATLNLLDLILSLVGYSKGATETEPLTAWLIRETGVNGFVVLKMAFLLASVFLAYRGERELDSRGVAWFLAIVGFVFCAAFGLAVITDIFVLSQIPNG